MQVQQLLDLLAQTRANSVTLVAIDGHSAAGKSTWATVIQVANSNVTIVHVDDFYRPMDESERYALDAAAGYVYYYDWKRLEEQVLLPLRAAQSVCYQQYDWQRNLLDGWVTIKPEGIVVVEGCYSMRPELRGYYNAMVLVETSPALRRQRQRERANASEDWLRRWDAAERYYMATYQPEKFADLVVSGE